MKKLLILLLAIFLILAGCSQDAADAPINNEINDTIEEIDDEINEKNEDTNEPEAEEDEKTDVPVIEKPSEEESENEELTEEISGQEEPIIEEVTEEGQIGEEQGENIENTLKIKGLVEKELCLTLEELKAMDDIIFEADFYSLNNFGTTGYTRFKGVKLWDLLKNEGIIKAEASKISIIAQDGYSMEFTPEQVQMEYMDETNPDNKYPMIIAWEENGREYSLDEGNPYKLVVGQKEPGDINKPQWVSNIDLILVE
jgi:DMSO/TMAO reductase YedYZ molybdopterin-dependent catalytic subunit